MKPALTVGMAHHEDYDGVYFTVQALRMFHSEVMPLVEFVIVDNSPESPAGKLIAEHAKSWMKDGTAGAKYVPLPGNLGTSPSRDLIFRHANADAVLVMDCHVLLQYGALKTLIDFYVNEEYQDKNIYHGPLVFDTLHNITTHFNDEWRAEMWGTWGQAWKAPKGRHVSTFEQGGCVALRDLKMGGQVVDVLTIPWPGHEQELLKRGFVRLGAADTDPPFEIPGQGLGLFSCTKDAWPGFNPHARGFGGEELYIHEKFRRQGGKAMCLPFLKWLHRFGRPAGVRYPLSRYLKVRNYVLEFQELGLDLKPVHDHFVASGLMDQKQWDHLVKNPIAHIQEPAGASCGSCGHKTDQEEKLSVARSPDELYLGMKSIVRDLNQHLPKLRELAGQCRHVTEFSKRRESTVALYVGLTDAVAKGGKAWLVSYNAERDHTLEQLKEWAPDMEGAAARLTLTHAWSTEVQGIVDTDMLFIDSKHSYKMLAEELNKFAPNVRRYIVCRGTKANAEQGEDGSKPGLLTALREFMKSNPEWSVVYHSNEQYGLTVLGRLAEDKPQLPDVLTMAGNFASTMAKHAADGFRHVDESVLRGRLETCSTCPHRLDDRCSVCGCFLDAKAAMRVSECPLGLWKE